eukprot:3183084-Prymnesium_polylepis.1
MLPDAPSAPTASSIARRAPPLASRRLAARSDHSAHSRHARRRVPSSGQCLLSTRDVSKAAPRVTSAGDGSSSAPSSSEVLTAPACAPRESLSLRDASTQSDALALGNSTGTSSCRAAALASELAKGRPPPPSCGAATHSGECCAGRQEV